MRSLALGLACLLAGCLAADSDGDAAEAVGESDSALLGSEANFRDPGTGAWQKVAPSVCGLDASKLTADIPNYAIFRYGKQCFMKGSDNVASMFSATKTLGGLMLGRAAYLTRNIPRTGPGTGPILPEDKATDWLRSVNYNSNARLTHVMSMCADNASLDYGQKEFEYDTVGSVQINTLIDVTKKCIKQIPSLGSDASDFVEAQIFDKLGMTKSYWLPVPLGIAAGWYANMSEMGRLGMLLLHDGWYNGERLIASEWVYRMSHPAFEDANTSYGHLTWLNHRGNAHGVGGNILNPPSENLYPNGDPCAPAAFWPAYPHGISSATSCLNAVPGGTCSQLYDVGVFSAQGAGGQYIVMHPGLDLVIVAKDYNVENGPILLWNAVRPALVAMDPVYKDKSMQEFCDAYGAGAYAPDLPMARHP
ncbi:MAG: hypothetical protein QM778_28255 [Myxococcales bacterium]